MDDFPVDVSHLRPVRTARFKLGVQPNPQSAPTITLIGIHAGRSNAAFLNAIMKLDGEYTTAVSVAQLDAGDEKRAEVFARTVWTGWEGPCFADGKPAPYTPERCMKVISALLAEKRGDVVGAAMRFYTDADNFTEGAASSEALGKE